MEDEQILNIELPSKDPTIDQANEEVHDVLLEIVQNLVKCEEDPEQDQLITSLQKHRSLILRFATLAYLRNPNSAKMLESIISLTAAMEKAVREDRKEAAKKIDSENSQISFMQIVESLNAISAGVISTPTFELTNFILDSSKSLTEVCDTFKPIKDTELTQGNGLVDLEGNVI